MSGWNSLQSVGTFHSVLQAAGWLVAVFVLAASLTALHYRSRWTVFAGIIDRIRNNYLPRWKIDTEATVHNVFAGATILGTAALLALVYGSFAYGQRKSELVTASHAAEIAKAHAEADALRHAATQAATHQATEIARVRAEAEALHRNHADDARRSNTQAATQQTAQIAELQQRLQQTESRRTASVESLRWEVKQAEAQAEVKISRLERELAQAERKIAILTSKRRLTVDEKEYLIDALRPFSGQKISIAAIAGNDDDKVYVTDFVEVFEAAGWEHPDVTYGHWERDPVGVEITLNEADGRAGRVNVAVGALINVVRKLGLTDGNTIFMNGDIPAGQVQIKIGKKLPR